MGSLESIASWAYKAADYFFTKEEGDSRAYQEEPTYYSGGVGVFNAPSIESDKKLEKQVDYSDPTTFSQLKEDLLRIIQALDKESASCKKEVQGTLSEAKKWENEARRLLEKRNVLNKKLKDFPKALSKRLKQKKLAIEKELNQIDTHHRSAREKMASARNRAKKQTEQATRVEGLLSEAKKIQGSSSCKQLDTAQIKAQVIQFEKTLSHYSQDYPQVIDRSLLGRLKV